MIQPDTYLKGSGVDVELADGSAILFRAWLNHGPGNDETLVYRIGKSRCSKYDVLALESDWSEESSPLAWLPFGMLAGAALWDALVFACWDAEKTINEFEESNYTEVLDDADSLMKPSDVDRIAAKVWPDYSAEKK